MHMHTHIPHAHIPHIHTYHMHTNTHIQAHAHTHAFTPHTHTYMCTDRERYKLDNPSSFFLGLYGFRAVHGDLHN